jgi:hypothetical protein
LQRREGCREAGDMYQASLGLRVGHHHRIMSRLYIALTLLQIVLINVVQYNLFTKHSHPTCIGKLASEAKPPGSSQGVRSGWRGILLVPASWILPDLLGVPKRPGDHPTRASELASKAKPPGTSQEVRVGGEGPYLRQQAGFKSQTSWGFPTGQGTHPTRASELASEAKPPGTSQGARSGWRETLLVPASWLSPNLLGLPKRPRVERK